MIAALVDCLAAFYQSGNMEQMEIIARSMLAAMPDDLVALQFLGLALYQMGQVSDAYRVFTRVAVEPEGTGSGGDPTVCEPASVVSYREATRAQSGLADGWDRIAEVLDKFGLKKPAARAREAALAARGAGVATGVA